MPKTKDNQSLNEERWQVWLKQAKFDLSAAFLSLENEYFEWATYQAEQAVEKALKSVIVHAGAKAPKIHKLGILFGFCNQVNEEFRNTDFNFKHIESFTFISRYPFLLPDRSHTPHEIITESDANKALVEASEVILKISKILKKQLTKSVQITDIKEEVYSAQEIVKRTDIITKALVKKFNPESIILFGRFAREWGKPLSGTMDILIIAECPNCSFVERIYDAREATRGGAPIIEPLVYTPEEIHILHQENESFLKSAFAEGKILFEKTPV